MCFWRSAARRWPRKTLRLADLDRANRTKCQECSTRVVSLYLGPDASRLERPAWTGFSSVRSLCELAPVTGLDPGDRFVAAVAVRPEHRCFAFSNVEPVFAESIHDVRFMCDDDDIGAGGRHRAGHLAQRGGAPVVLDRCNHESALGVVSRDLDVAETHQRAGVYRPLEQAGVNLANRNPEFVQRLSDRFCERAALVVELALLEDVLRIKWVGVGLILIGCTMAKNDHIAAVTQRLEPFGLRRCALAAGGQR